MDFKSIGVPLKRLCYIFCLTSNVSCNHVFLGLFWSCCRYLFVAIRESALNFDFCFQLVAGLGVFCRDVWYVGLFLLSVLTCFFLCCMESLRESYLHLVGYFLCLVYSRCLAGVWSGGVGSCCGSCGVWSGVASLCYGNCVVVVVIPQNLLSPFHLFIQSLT